MSLPVLVAHAEDYITHDKRMVDAIAQDTAAYLPESDKVAIEPENSSQLAENYIQHYLYPWSGSKKLLQQFPDIKQSEAGIIKTYQKTPGYAANGLVHGPDWITQIADNMNLAAFPNLNMKAIMVHNSAVRQLPTQDTSFKAWNVDGDGYPFDNLQTSLIAANTPVLVLHTTRDGSWYLVLTTNYYGWVPSYNVAFVSADFIDQWQKHAYVIPLQDIMASARKLSDPAVQLRIGTLYPLVSQSADSYHIYVAVADSNHQATLKKIRVSKQYLAKFPLAVSTANASKLANRLLGNPYGWGGMYGFRDCSATTMDIMTSMGIWLPRNSLYQSRTGQSISFAGMSDAQKIQTMIKYGVPLFTLVHMPGHIMLYVGEKNGHPYIYHDSWAVRGTAVTPVDILSRTGNELISRMDSMTILVKPESPKNVTAHPMP